MEGADNVLENGHGGATLQRGDTYTENFVLAHAKDSTLAEVTITEPPQT